MRQASEGRSRGTQEDRGNEHGLRATTRRIVGSWRVYAGLTTNALSSLGNFAVSIALVRALDLDELGAFAIAFAVYIFCSGLVRASVTEPLLAVAAGGGDLRGFARRTSLLALIASALTMAVGGIFSMSYLVVIGAAMHGLIIFDYSKTMNLALFRRSIALIQEIAWFFASVVAGVLVATGIVEGLVGFAIWAGAGALIGYVSSGTQRLDLRPIWSRDRIPSQQALAFGGDFVIGSGSSQISLNLIGVAAGLSVLGAVRAGATLLGPISLVVGSARTLAIPFLTRRIALGRKAARTGALAATLLIAILSAPLLAVVAFLPDSVGGFILGANWEHASGIIPFLALEMLFIALTTVPFAGFRSLLAGRASINLRSALAILRVMVVPAAAVFGGATAAAVALAAVAAVSTLVWWAGYLYLLKHSAIGVPA